MRKVAGLLLLTLAVFSLSAQVKLSDEAQISILTCSPSEEAAFTVYGHTAIRISDAANGIDLAFNYGLFDFSRRDFVYRFAKGATDYMLGVTAFERFLAEYRMRGSGVTEQILNLTPDEKDSLWEKLLANVRPENAIYRYNFFFDNCSTRPAAMVERCVNGETVYRRSAKPQTFRRLINDCMRNKPWLVFGCDLALGSPADRTATPHEEMFLPLYLQAALAEAAVISPDGRERKLVSQTNRLAEEVLSEAGTTVFTPLLCSILLLIAVVAATYWEWRTGKYCRWMDCLLFFAGGMAGTVLFFLAFVSEHPATWPNWSLLWLHPFHLAGAVCFSVKKFQKAALYYHFFNFAILSLMLAGWLFIPQHFNAACFPLAVCLWIRSGRKGAIFIKRK